MEQAEGVAAAVERRLEPLKAIPPELRAAGERRAAGGGSVRSGRTGLVHVAADRWVGVAAGPQR